MNGRPFFVLLFSSGTVLGDVPRTVLLKLSLRHPRRAYFWFLAWLIRTLTDSDISHVAVGVRDRVVDFSIAGDRVWPIDMYLRRYPGVCEFFLIPAAEWPELPRPRAYSRPAWPTLLRWCTRGEYTARDCVADACDFMRGAGVGVPNGIISPDDLRSWCRVKGFHCERLVEV